MLRNDRTTIKRVPTPGMLAVGGGTNYVYVPNLYRHYGVDLDPNQAILNGVDYRVVSFNEETQLIKIRILEAVS